MKESIYVAAFNVDHDYEPKVLNGGQIWNTARGPVFLEKDQAISAIAFDRPDDGKEHHAYEIEIIAYDVHSIVDYKKIGTKA